MLERLRLGESYSKAELAEALEVPVIKNIQTGSYTLKEAPYTLLFVTLDKKGTEDHLHYNDFFEGPIFHWDSKYDLDINSPSIRPTVTGERTPLLFARIIGKLKGKTLPFFYCGRLEYNDHIASSARPVHIMYNSLDYDPTSASAELIAIYEWKPKSVESSPQESEQPSKAPERKFRSYTKPTITARRGLVTSRVGQGYYRQLVIGKWKGRCAVTGCDLTEILIASHIVPWRDSTEEERLDPDNGILLSPVIDALFDKHLISFDEKGMILISERLNEGQCSALNITKELRLKVDVGIGKYLERHREEFYLRSITPTVS